MQPGPFSIHQERCIEMLKVRMRSVSCRRAREELMCGDGTLVSNASARDFTACIKKQRAAIKLCWHMKVSGACLLQAEVAVPCQAEMLWSRKIILQARICS